MVCGEGAEGGAAGTWVRVVAADNTSARPTSQQTSLCRERKSVGLVRRQAGNIGRHSNRSVLRG
jgi:hypothetical protein